MAPSVDVIVVGGGVAGSTLAILLGRAGLGVRLYEQHSFPREKPCAEGLMPAGVAVLERLGLLDAVGGARFRGVRYHGFGRRVGGDFPVAGGVPTYGVGQRRLRLDAALFAAAAATPNVQAATGIRVEAPLLANGRVAGVHAGGQTVRAGLVVAADGPRSRLRRRLGLDAPTEGTGRVGVRAHFRLAAGQASPGQVEVFIGERHELYLTPLPDREVALAALSADAHLGASRPREGLARLVARHPALAARLEGAAPAGELAGQKPLESRARRGHAPGLVLLGDAAGFVDPVTGAGMAQALASAELLAALIARPMPGRPPALDAGETTLAGFDRLRRQMLRDSVLLTRLVLALVRRPTLASAALFLMGASPRLYRHLIGVASGTRALVPGAAPLIARAAALPAGRQP